MAMNRAQFAKLLQDGLNTVWGLEYKQREEEWRRVFQVESSKKAFEEDQQVTGFGAAVVKAEGAGLSYDEAASGFVSRYDHETIALAFTITAEAIEDNLYMQMGAKYAKALARSMIHTKEIKAAAVLNNAFNAAFAIGDGKQLIAIDHPTTGGAVQSNALATPADLAEASLEDLLVQIRKAKDDRGIPIALKAVDLIIPPESEFIAVRLLESTLRPGQPGTATGGLNDVNAINRKGIFGKEPIVLSRLTDADAFFIKTDCNDGLKMFQRVAVSTKMEEEFNTTNWRYRARERYSFGVSDWRQAFGSSGG